MNTSKLLKLFLCVFILSALLTGTGFAKDVESLAIIRDGADVSGKSVYLNYIDTYTFDVTVNPGDADADLVVTSSNKNLAEASISGTTVTVATKNVKGSVQITVRDNNTKKSVSVRMYVQKLTTDVTVNDPGDVYFGSSVKMTAVVGPSDATNKSIKWLVYDEFCAESDPASCDPTTAASINASGVLTGKQVTEPTDVRVLACPMDGGASCGAKLVTIKPVKVTLASDRTEVFGGESFKINTTFEPADTKSKQLKWTVYEGGCDIADLQSCTVSGAATVNSAGTVTAKKVDSDEPVTAVACLANNPTVCDKWPFTVKSVTELKTLKLEFDGEDCTGKTIYLDPENSGLDEVQIVTDPSGATVTLTVTGSNDSIAEATYDGSTTITVTTTSEKGTMRITVRDAVSKKTAFVNVKVQTLTTDVTVNSENDEIYSDTNEKMTAEITPEEADIQNVKWYVYDYGCDPTDLSACTPTEAAVISSAGVLTGNQVSEPTDVTVLACPLDGGAVCGTKDIKVKPVEITLTSDKTDEYGDINVYSGESFKINAAFVPAGTKNKQLKWTVYDGSCEIDNLESCTVSEAATVNSAGTVTAKNVDSDEPVTAVACLANNPTICNKLEFTVKKVTELKTLKLEFDGEDCTGKTIYLSPESVYSDSDGVQIVTYPSDATVTLTVTGSNDSIAEAAYDDSTETITVTTTSEKGTMRITVRDAVSKKSVSVNVKVQQLTTGVTVNGADEVYSGMNEKMTVDIDPVNADNKNVKWNVYKYVSGSCDETDQSNCTATEAATISSAGLLTGKNVADSEDVLVIACPLDGGADCGTQKVTVKPVTVDIDSDVTEIKGGESFTIDKVTFDPESAKNQKLQWKVYDVKGSCDFDHLDFCAVSNYATVNSSGKVTAKKVIPDEGVAVMAVACLISNPAECDHFEFTIEPVNELQALKLKYDGEDYTGKTIYLDTGKSAEVEIALIPGEADKDLTVTGSNDNIAVVSYDPDTEPLKISVETKTLKGSMRIMVRDSVSKKSAYVNIMVQVMPEKIEILGDSNVYAGSTSRMEAVITPSTISNKNVNWYVYKADTSCNPPDLTGCIPAKAASINNTGVLTGIQLTPKQIDAGETYEVLVVACTAADKNVCDDLSVTVLPVSFTLNTYKDKGVHEVYSGASITIRPEFTPADTKNKQLKWNVYKGEGGCGADSLDNCTPTGAATVTSGTVTGKEVGSGGEYVLVIACMVSNPEICESYDVTVKPAAKSIAVFNDDTGEELGSSVPVMLAAEDGTVVLRAESNPDEGTYKWTSSSPSIATVDDLDETTGKTVTVKGLKKGLAVITVSSNNGKVKKTVKIQVLGKLVNDISIEAPSTELVDGKSMQLKATVLPVEADKKNVKWSLCKYDYECPDMYHATISATGKLSVDGVSVRTEITVYAEATDGSGVYDTIKITLIPKAKAMFIVDANEAEDMITIPYWGDKDEIYHSPDLTDLTAPVVKELNYKDKKTVKLAALLLFNDSLKGDKYYHVDQTTNVIWRSSDRNTADVFVDEDGFCIVTFYKPGTVTITAQTQDGSNLRHTARITARILPEEVLVYYQPNSETPKDFGPLALGAGRSLTLGWEILPNNTTEKRLKWFSLDEHIATVNNSGRVTASRLLKTLETVKICAETADQEWVDWEPMRSCIDVEVYPLVESVAIVDEDGNDITYGTYSVDVTDSSAEFGAVTYPTDASDAVEWSSSDSNIAEIDAKTGAVTLKGRKGSVRITARATDGSGCTARFTLRVVTRAEALKLDASTRKFSKAWPETWDKNPSTTFYVRSGYNIRLTTTVNPPDTTDKSIRWTVGDPRMFEIKNTSPVVDVTAADLSERVCGLVTAETMDGSELSKDIYVCVVPYVRSVRIFNSMDQDITGQEWVIPVGTTFEKGTDIYSRNYPYIDSDNCASQEVTWDSDNKGVLSFDGTTFEAVKEGTAYVNVRAQDGSNSSGNFRVRVMKEDEYNKIYSTFEESSDPVTGPEVESHGEDVLVIEGPDTAAAGGKFSLNVVGAKEGTGVFWFSSNEDAAKIDADGQVVIAEDAAEDTVVMFTAILNDGKSTAAIHEVKITAAPVQEVDIVEEELEETTPMEDDILSQLVQTLLNGSEEPEPEMANGDAAGQEPVYAEAAEPTEEQPVFAEPETPAEVPQEGTVPEPTEEPDQVEEPEPEEGPADETAVPAEITEEPADPQTETQDAPAEDAPETAETAEPAADEGTEADEPAAAEGTDEEPAETPAPAVEEVVITDYESETARFELFAGSELVIEPEKIMISPVGADWSEMTFEIENEAVAVLDFDEIARILEEGLKIKGLTAGVTVLKIKAGDYEKEIPVVISAVPVPAADPVLTEVTPETAEVPEQPAEEFAAEPFAEQTVEEEPAAAYEEPEQIPYETQTEAPAEEAAQAEPTEVIPQEAEENEGIQEGDPVTE